MTAIDRTIYRRVKRNYTTKELIEAYTTTEFVLESSNRPHYCASSVTKVEKIDSIKRFGN
jgi:hypothetical protein